MQGELPIHAAGSSLPLEGSLSLPGKAPDPTAGSEPCQPVHHRRQSSPELSSLRGPPHPRKPSPVPLSPSPPLPNPLNSPHNPRPVLQAQGLVAMLLAHDRTMEELHQCLLRQGPPRLKLRPAPRADWDPG